LLLVKYFLLPVRLVSVSIVLMGFHFGFYFILAFGFLDCGWGVDGDTGVLAGRTREQGWMEDGI